MSYQIEKKYHFYAAHRNHQLDGPCSNLHGHTYYVEVVINPPQAGEDGVSFLFSEIDRIIEPIIKALDHCTLMYTGDPIFDDFVALGMAYYEIDQPTSAENIASHLFNCIRQAGIPISELRVRETQTSNVVYNGPT